MPLADIRQKAVQVKLTVDQTGANFVDQGPDDVEKDQMGDIFPDKSSQIQSFFCEKQSTADHEK